MVNNIANIIPTTQAVALAGHNLSKIKGKKVSTKDILGLGVTNVVGTGLIRATASITAGL